MTGVAGSGKTEVLLHVCDKMRGRVQVCASTGKAASYFNGPTLHAMLGLSQKDISEASMPLHPNNRKCEDNRRIYANIDLFIVDEVSMVPAYMLGFVEFVMRMSFDPTKTFGGKRVIFVGDPAQLPPVDGEPFYLDRSSVVSRRNLKSRRAMHNARGKSLYQDILRNNVIIFKRNHRVSGLLAACTDRLRNGTQTEDDRLKITYQRT